MRGIVMHWKKVELFPNYEVSDGPKGETGIQGVTGVGETGAQGNTGARLQNGYRIKFKSAEYLKVARMISNMTPLAFWKTMEMGKVKVDYLEQLPEEFREEADNLTFNIELKYSDIKRSLETNFRLTTMALFIDDDDIQPDDRKKIGLFCKENKLQTGAMFAILDNKEDVLDKVIMKAIRPKGNQLC